ncbi:MAG: putative 2-hydroxyacid dehydrogenase [Anaerospora sp.]|nr:putative 2-hydroxyacid dehydrogenase [Anaerospora sp.]
MPVVVSTVPKWRFDTSEVVVPSEWKVIFCNPANEKELAEACREADCLLVLASFPEVTASVLQQLKSVKLILPCKGSLW